MGDDEVVPQVHEVHHRFHGLSGVGKLLVNIAFLALTNDGVPAEGYDGELFPSRFIELHLSPPAGATL